VIISYIVAMATPFKAMTQRRGPGRPREFDMEVALDRALLVFREHGYHAASLGDLGSAMKLTPGSIYKAFSDKRAIFLAAFDRYTNLRNTKLRQLLDAQTNGLDKLRAMLGFYAEASHGIEGRRGCLVVGSATELATFDPEMAARVTAALQRAETLLRDLIRLGQSDGSIPSGIDAAAPACALLCLLQGLRVIGKAGRTRAEMMAAVDQALRLLA
jgi:TetR/AcrR family transcriptional regulator, transcriptional repressor for nem operon